MQGCGADPKIENFLSRTHAHRLADLQIQFRANYSLKNSI